MLVNQIEL